MKVNDSAVAESTAAPAADEMAGLRIESQDRRAVRFALLPHFKPVLLLCENGRFSVALLAVEYTNAHPQTGMYDKDPKTGQAPLAEWRVGYVKLSQYEFWRLCQLREDDNYEKLYGYDLVMFNWPPLRQTEIYIKSRKPCWTRDPQVASEVEEAARQLASGLVERLGREAAVKASVEDWKELAQRAHPVWKEGVAKPYSLALVDQAAEDFPGFAERCRKVLGGARASETFLMDDATAFMQLDYLAHGSDAMHDPYGSEPAANFFLDTHWREGIGAIRKFANEYELRLSTASAVLMTSIAHIMRVDLEGEDEETDLDIIQHL